TAGYRAAAVLGAGLPDRRVAEALARRGGAFAIAFDADDAGRAGAAKLREMLSHVATTSVLEIAPPESDLNSWVVAHGSESVAKQLRMAIGLGTARRPQGRGRSIA